MIFNAFQREADDAVFTVVRNVSGGSLSAGAAVVWDSSSSIDGVRVTKAASATLSLFRGILVDTLADSAYGKCQTHGYNTVASVINSTDQAIAAGNILICVASQTYLAYSAAGDGKSGFVFAGEAFATDATPAAAATKVLIRAL